MCDEAYESYVTKCAHFGLSPTPRALLEKHEVYDEKEYPQEQDSSGFISVAKAKDLVKKAYVLGYKEAMREIAS